MIRIVAPEGNYDYQNKYFTDDTKYLVPCGLPEGEEQAIQEIVLKAYRVLGCRGWGRVDVMIDAATRKPYLLEINTSPGMTGHSLVPMSARAAGISYEDLCLQLLASASLDQEKEAPRHERHSMPAPFDVKLMNITATALLSACVVLLLAAVAWWALRHPLFAIGGITVQGDVTHNSAVDPARQRRAAAGRQLLHRRTWPRARRPSRPCPGCARPWCAASSRTGCACSCRSTGPSRLWGGEAESRLVNSFGEVFEANVGEVEQDGLPRLVGPGRPVGAGARPCTACCSRCSSRWTWPSIS